jgi:outer membrane lipoprotein-sorting protein
MKSIKLLILLLAIQTLASAQQDPKASQLLDAVAVKMQGYKTIYAEFDFTLINQRAKIKENQKGTLKLKGVKFNMVLGNNEQFFDGKTLWTWMRDQDEVHISEPNFEEQGSVNPLNMVDSYKQNFKYIYAGEVTEAGKVLSVIELIPKSLKKSFSKIKVLVNKTTQLIHSSTTHYKNGNLYTIKVNNYQFNQAFQDALFTFEPKSHPNVEQVDLRE